MNSPSRDLFSSTAQGDGREGILAVQSDGTVISTNAELAHLVGVVPETFCGKHFAHCIAKESRTQVRAAWESFMAHGDPYRISIHTRNGVAVALTFVGGVWADEGAMVVMRPVPGALEQRLEPLQALNVVSLSKR